MAVSSRLVLFGKVVANLNLAWVNSSVSKIISVVLVSISTGADVAIVITGTIDV